jgi:hypothetical protein
MRHGADSVLVGFLASRKKFPRGEIAGIGEPQLPIPAKGRRDWLLVNPADRQQPRTNKRKHSGERDAMPAAVIGETGPLIERLVPPTVAHGKRWIVREPRSRLPAGPPCVTAKALPETLRLLPLDQTIKPNKREWGGSTGGRAFEEWPHLSFATVLRL